KEREKGSDNKEELNKKKKKLLEGHVLEFLISLLDYYLKDNKYKSVFVTARTQKKRVAKIIEKKEFTKENAKDLALDYFNLIKKIAN
ncbi:hypothetical protein K469DRAFT_598756, partial [Zopfia rhizophila CBS 207.26]